MGEICCRSQDSSGKVYIIEKKISRKLKEQTKNSRLLQPDKSTLLFYVTKNSRLLQPDKSTLLFYATKNSRLLQPDKSTLLFYEAIAEKIFKTNYEVLVVKVIPVNP